VRRDRYSQVVPDWNQNYLECHAHKPLSERVLGRCCACGYDGPLETPCRRRIDGSHCDCWWDGPDLEDAP